MFALASFIMYKNKELHAQHRLIFNLSRLCGFRYTISTKCNSQNPSSWRYNIKSVQNQREINHESFYQMVYIILVPEKKYPSVFTTSIIFYSEHPRSIYVHVKKRQCFQPWFYLNFIQIHTLLHFSILFILFTC